MSINETDVKKLWGLAAGRCSFPACDEECIKFLDSNNPTIIGEMAHIIAHSPHGPRGVKSGGSNSYENLILLCPTHHRLVDKAPQGRFPAEILMKWKSDHEAEVCRTFLSEIFNNKKELCQTIKRFLIENHQIWITYGPDSSIAKTNPFSNTADVWTLRKLDSIVPNNRRVINLINQHKNLFTMDEYRFCCAFIEHAEGFEASCYHRQDSVPKFPQEFQGVIETNV